MNTIEKIETPSGRVVVVKIKAPTYRSLWKAIQEYMNDYAVQAYATHIVKVEKIHGKYTACLERFSSAD